MFELVSNVWPYAIGTLAVLLALGTSAHIVLYKRDARAAVAWVGMVIVFPIAGAVLYVLLGINRIQRLAAGLRQERLRLEANTAELQVRRHSIQQVLPAEDTHLTGLGRLVDRVTRIPITAGNEVRLLVNGDAAYPAMLEAIDGAQHTVALSTYIFDNDHAGMMFADALERAVERGVEVCVLIDGGGGALFQALDYQGTRATQYSGCAVPAFAVPVADAVPEFEDPPQDPRDRRLRWLHRRNEHSEGHLLESSPKSPVRDIHFRFEGPVVAHLMHMFAEDWAFTTREILGGPQWFPRSIPWAKLRREVLLTARTKTSASCAGCCSVRSPARNTVSAS